MIFASQIFLFWFLPLVLALYYATPRAGRNALLVLASYVFYGWWRVDFLSLMLLSTLFDFVFGKLIGREGEHLRDLAPDSAQAAACIRKRRLLLTASMVGNLGLLGYFKYMNFGVDTLNVILARFGMEGVQWPHVVLPIGISFYTFQTMSYTIDVYRGDAPPVRSFVDFACFVALFPQLVAGPIVRYQVLADQLRVRAHTWSQFCDGAMLFQMGFLKKILLADTVAGVADGAYALADPSAAEAWLGTVAYAFQIYFDFSGYSDMAIGLGLMFGFRFPINFDSPYRSRSITEFWRRWHITLSTWLRDYLYIPLGGNRRGEARTLVNLMLTMLLGGLWHGAAWTFVAWGAWQGLWLVIERGLGRRPFYARTPAFIQVAATFVIALFGWVLFRATSMDQALEVAGSMLFLDGASGGLRLEVDSMQRWTLVVCAVLVWFAPNSNQIAADRRSWIPLGVALAFPLAVCHLFFQSYSPFLYFQF